MSTFNMFKTVHTIKTSKSFDNTEMKSMSDRKPVVLSANWLIFISVTSYIINSFDVIVGSAANGLEVCSNYK